MSRPHSNSEWSLAFRAYNKARREASRTAKAAAEAAEAAMRAAKSGDLVEFERAKKISFEAYDASDAARKAVEVTREAWFATTRKS